VIELTGYQDKHEYTNKYGVKSVVYLMDNMEAMPQFKPKEFSIACIDPPYGIGVNMNAGRKKSTRSKKRLVKKWDNETPPLEFFAMLTDVSQNQIIWGANHMIDKIRVNAAGWIFWDKCVADGCSFSDGELAWTSFDRSLKKIVSPWSGFIGSEGDKFHPTTKPVALYDRIFHNYAKPNDTILDTHLGSGSSRIAADRHNLPFTGIELDTDYFYAHCKRFDNHTAQQTLF
jgi:site-specific DNA-methyltransferase (adenine-specific)